jgi:ABC-type polysaccharide/polyol phosphate export permease
VLSVLGSLRSNRRLLHDFVRRDLRSRYVGSTMGFFWSVVFPIINLFVYMFVFRIVLKARWSDYQGPLEVALVMLAGIVIWAAFAETVSRGTNCLVENSNLIQKVVFPSELLPVYLTISSLINMCIGLPVVILCIGWFTFVSRPEVEFAHEGQVLGETGVASYVTIHLTRGSPHDVHVQYEVSGSAEGVQDYVLARDEVVIPSGRLTYRLQLNSVRDFQVEGEEFVHLDLTGVQGAALGALRRHTVRISEEEPLAGGEAGGATREHILSQLGPGRADPDYHPLALGVSLLALPLLFLLQFVFTTGLGFVLATVNVFFRDVYHLMGVFITVWMFGTPIFYPFALVREAGYGWLMELNPMHWMIDSYRTVLVYGEWPAWRPLLQLAVVGSVLFLLGGKFFMAQKKRFPDLL